MTRKRNLHHDQTNLEYWHMADIGHAVSVITIDSIFNGDHQNAIVYILTFLEFPGGLNFYVS